MTNSKQKIVSLCQFATIVNLIIILYDVQKMVDMKQVVFSKVYPSDKDFLEILA